MAIYQAKVANRDHLHDLGVRLNRAAQEMINNYNTIRNLTSQLAEEWGDEQAVRMLELLNQNAKSIEQLANRVNNLGNVTRKYANDLGEAAAKATKGMQF
jgi:DNA repair ATPase RecN